MIELPKNLIAKLFAERFKFSRRIEIKQNIVDVLKGVGNSARQADRLVVLYEFARFGYWLNVLEVLKTR